MYQKISNSWLKHWDFILLDLAGLQIAYFFSVIARNGWCNPYANEMYASAALVIALADICTVFFTEAYRGIMRRGYFREFCQVVRHVAIVYAIELAYLFLTQQGGAFSRLSFVIFAVSAFLLLYAARVIWKWYLLQHKKVFYKKRALLVVASADRAARVIRTVLDNTYNELEVIGAVIAGMPDMVGGTVEGVPLVCSVDGIPDYIQTRWVDSILINVKKEAALPESLIHACINMGVTVHSRVADLERDSQNQQLDRVGGYIVLSSSLRMASPSQLLMKRLLDICGGLVGMVMCLFLGILIGPAIYLSSPGPIFFSQVRIGRNGRRFKIYKFRSMYLDAEQHKKELLERNEMQGLMFKMEADPRIIGSGPDGTRHGLGWFIRKTSIDEFPQFWNVLKGEMSLVGTRPPTEDEWVRYSHHHRARLAVKPGLTGIWQVSGRSNVTDFEQVVEMDKQYVQNWNLGLDIKIILKTVLVVFQGEGSK